MIYAITNKRHGRGRDRHWQAFACHTEVQSEVENFMLSLGYGCQDYTLHTRSDFKTSTELFNDTNYHPNLLWLEANGPCSKYIWIMETEVLIKKTKKGYKFTVVYEE